MHKTNGRTTSPRVYNRHYEKVGNSEPVCIETELPFDIPDSWCWVRINEISDLGMGQTILTKEMQTDGIPVYSATIDNKPLGYISPSNNKINLTQGDLVVPARGNSIGYITYVIDISASCTQTTIYEKFFDKNISKWVGYYYQAFKMTLFKYFGAAIPQITISKLKEHFIPLPPLAEQKRIVAEMEKYEPLIIEYDKLEQQKNKLDGEIYDKLKKSILQYAIQGKLVPQDERDEPASELLKRIRAEKKAQLGKKYVDSYIYKGDDNCYYEKIGAEVKNITEEIPFDIPQKWEWMRLKQIIDFSKNSSISSEQIPDEAWILDLEDIEKDSGKIIKKKQMREVKAKSDKHTFYQGNVLYSKLRPYLNKVIVADEDGFCTSEILAFDFSPIMSEYAKVYLMSPFFVDYAMNGVYGVKMPRIGSERGNNALMPLPPLDEQKRIVLRLNELFDKLKDEV